MSTGYEDPTIPDIRLPGGGLEGAQPDALTPYTREYEREGIGRKFDIPAQVSLLDTLDDPSQLIPAVMERGGDLSVAEVILSEILSTMRERTHREGGSDIIVPVIQSSAGYFRIAQPPSANQYLRVVTIVLSGTAAGTMTVQFLHGTNGSASDAALSGPMALVNGAPMFLHAPNPRGNPVLFSSPGAILGLVSASGTVNGFVVYQLTAAGA